LAKSNQITFEVCPISNSRTGVIENYTDHPIRKLMKEQLLITVNTDDCGIFDSDIIEEYELLSKHFNISTEEFYQFNLNALNASFLDQKVKDQVKQKYFQ
jgi:adenosine deaminase